MTQSIRTQSEQIHAASPHAEVRALRRVCLFGEHAGAALQGYSVKGGAEMQTALLGKALAMKGIDVVVVDPRAKDDFTFGEHLVVEAIPQWEKGLRGVRFFTHRLPRLISSLRRARADAYYARGFFFLNIIAWFVARLRGARYFQAVAADLDLMSQADRHSHRIQGVASLWDWVAVVLPDELLCPLLLRLADAVLVQHPEQARLVETRARRVFQLNSIVDVESHGSSPGKDRKNVVIVGRLSKIKGLWNLVPIIQELKTVNFEFVGDVRDSEGEAVKLELMKCCNVIFRGALDRKNTLQTIGAGKALLNTSPREGFPNTFIEAWALGTPVISLTVDPGGLLTSQHLGYVCNGDANKLKGLLLQDTYDLDTARIRQYVEDHFSMTYVAEEFERIFQQCS